MFLITIYMPFAPNQINSIVNCETLLNISTTIAIFCFFLMVVWFFFGLSGSIFFTSLSAIIAYGKEFPAPTKYLLFKLLSCLARFHHSLSANPKNLS